MLSQSNTRKNSTVNDYPIVEENFDQSARGMLRTGPYIPKNLEKILDKNKKDYFLNNNIKGRYDYDEGEGP